jgi:hypothetical protein
MHDIVDIVKNIQTLAADDSSFKILKDYERVLDDLDLYVFKNWEDGELLAGPNVSRYFVSCKFMWPENDMPDPEGAERLLEYGCKVTFQKNKILVPRKVRKPSDFRPGTKKGKIDPHPIWVVEITIPKKLMQDIFTGKELQDNIQYAEAMQRAEASNIEPTEAAQEAMPNQIDSTEQTDVPATPQ